MELSTVTLRSLIGAVPPISFPSYSATAWSFRDLTGWLGQTDDKVPLVERPQGHGAFRTSRSLRSSRAVSLTVTYIGGSQSDVENAFDVLDAVGADGPVVMSVTLPTGTTWRVVTVDKVTVTRWRGGSRYGQAAIDMIARDPRRYMSGDWVTTGPPSPGQGEVWPEVYPVVWPGGGSSGRVTLVNDGRAPSPSRFLLAGGFSSAQITCVETGARVGFDRLTPTGQVVEIDAGTGRATIGGQDVSRWLRYREWTDVPGLMSRSFQLDVTDPVGSPTLSGKVDHAWW